MVRSPRGTAQLAILPLGRAHVAGLGRGAPSRRGCRAMIHPRRRAGRRIRSSMLANFARHCLLLIAAGLCACTTAPPIVSSALPPIPDPGLRVDRPLSVGDIVAIDYFPSSVLEATPYVVGAGDLLRVDVFDHPELSRERVLVLPDGHI